MSLFLVLFRFFMICEIKLFVLRTCVIYCISFMLLTTFHCYRTSTENLSCSFMTKNQLEVCIDMNSFSVRSFFNTILV